MSNVVDLKLASLINNQELVRDLCQFREHLVGESFIRRKYRLDNATWERLGGDEGNALIEKIEEESIRRTRDGSSKREKSQLLVTCAPDVLSTILLDNNQSARHRIDSAKTLNDFAANGPETAGNGAVFEITINLGNESEHYRKVLNINPNDSSDVDNIDDSDTNNNSVPGGILAAFLTNKSGSNGGGQSV